MSSRLRRLYGHHAVLAKLRAAPASLRSIYVDTARNDARAVQLRESAARAGVRVVECDSSRLTALAGDVRHQGVVAEADMDDSHPSIENVVAQLDGPALLLVLDGVQDPHNLGACLRVADAAGAQAVIVPKDRAVGLTPTVAKVSSGASETVPLIAVTNLARGLDELKELGIWVVGTDAQSEQDIFAADLPGSIAWVLGAEGSGMRRLTRERCDLLVSLPLAGAVESLNVSVTAGICLYESVRRQRTPDAKT